VTTPDSNIEKKPIGALERLNIILDNYVLPYPVRFLTNRMIILATLGLLIPLLVFSNEQAFVNILNSYLNVMSVVVSSTVLLYATIADVRDRAAAKSAEKLTKAYEELLEKRILDRDEITKAYEEVLERRIQSREDLAKAYEQELEKRVQADHELIQQVLQNSMKNILEVQLEKIRIEDHKQIEDLQKALIAEALIASNQLLHTELADLKASMKALNQNNSKHDNG
jgi:hypothetical protein